MTMADFLPGRSTRTQGIEADRVFIAGNEAEFIFGQGTQLFPNLPVAIYSTTSSRLVADDTAEWFEFGFRMDASLTGNAAAGFTDAGNYFRLELQQSVDLVNWSAGKFLPAAIPVVDLGDGSFEYWSRCVEPRIWKYVTLDMTMTSDRASKSITALKLFGVSISLPHYPYAMPSQAATLQADLVAAGYTGATVSSVSHALSVDAANYGNDGKTPFLVTLSGSNVTDVKTPAGATISLPGYPYAMPSQAANLQAALVAAGYPYAGVSVYADAWTIFIPNRSTVFVQRDFTATITPADPYTYQDTNGTGTDSGNGVSGTSGNVRATTGLTPRTEAGKQFARLKITPGSRYDPWR